jgi:hypothetical protein
MTWDVTKGAHDIEPALCSMSYSLIHNRYELKRGLTKIASHGENMSDVQNNVLALPVAEAASNSPEDIENQIAGNGLSSQPREDQPLLRAPDLESWKHPPGFIWIEAAIMANVFLYGFDTTITAATYAVISSEFNAANTASWLTTSYLITSTAFQPLYGRFSDIFGRRACFLVSTVTFSLGCLGCGIAGDVVLLNLMRALTGFGGGGLMTMGALNLTSFTKPGPGGATPNSTRTSCSLVHVFFRVVWL